MGFGGALAECVLAAELADDAGHTVAVGGVDEVCGGVAAVVVVGEVGEVLANEAQPGGTRAGFQEERVGAEETGVGGGGAGGDGVELRDAVVDAGEQGAAEDAGLEAGGAELFDGGEAEIGAGGAGFELAG